MEIELKAIAANVKRYFAEFAKLFCGRPLTYPYLSRNDGRMTHPLRIFRTEKGISLERVAEILALTPASISRIENGKQTLTPANAILIESFFGIPRHALRPDLWESPLVRAHKGDAK